MRETCYRESQKKRRKERRFRGGEAERRLGEREKGREDTDGGKKINEKEDGQRGIRGDRREGDEKQKDGKMEQGHRRAEQITERSNGM